MKNFENVLITMALVNEVLVFATPKAQTVSAAGGWALVIFVAYMLKWEKEKR